MGLKYDGNLGGDKTNVLEGFADSSLSLPRSQGCRCVIMNNAAISFTSKRHTTTDDSTAAAELTVQYLSACDAEGNRNLMQEIGLKQDGSTVIRQDNQAASQIAMNRGALAKKTRAMDMRVMTIRNKIENMKVVSMYLRTSEMIADIETKSLDPKLFAYLRDKQCGYWKGEVSLSLSLSRSLSRRCRGHATLRKRAVDLPCVRCEELSLGAGAHNSTRGALVDPVSYGQQTTT
jgi:hypothetical protein